MHLPHSYEGNSGGTTFVNAKGSGDDSFIGSIHEVKEYTKYMEEYELLQTMVDSDPECMIGSKNGKANEFSDAQAVSVYEPATMEWIKMRRTLTAATPLAVKLELEENGHKLGRLVEMKFLKDTAFAGERVKISLNGRQFGSKQIPADGEVRFFINPSLLATVQKDVDTGRYPVTLTLVRGDSLATSLSLDYFTVGGSWQLGENNNSTKEFVGSSAYYDTVYNVGQRNLSQVVGAIGNTGLYAPLNLYFGMTDWAAANLDFRLTAKSVNALSFPATLTLNDGSVAPTVVSGVITTNIVFSAGQLKAGNRLKVSCNMTTGNTSWDSFDYWKLEALKPAGFRNSDEGLIVILK